MVTATVRSLLAYRLERRRTTDVPERLPLAIQAHAGAVSIVLADTAELWLTPDQALELARDLERCAKEANG